MTSDPDNSKPEANTAASPAQPPQRAPKFQALSTFYLADMDTELRRDIYNEVLAEVTRGTLPGMVHRGNVITLDMSNSRLTGNNASRLAKLEDILLKNLPDLHARLDALSEAVVLRHVINSAGKGVTIEELLKLGDDLDFDKMVATAQRKRRQNSKAASRKKPKPAG